MADNISKSGASVGKTTFKVNGYDLDMTVTSMTFKPKNVAMPFAQMNTERELIAVAKGDSDYLVKLRMKHGWEVPFCTPVAFDEDGEHFYAMWIEDCFDPPMAIVRASDLSEAIDRFVDACEWARTSEDDIKDAQEKEEKGEEFPDWYQQSDCGHWYNSDLMAGQELRIIRIEME